MAKHGKPRKVPLTCSKCYGKGLVPGMVTEKKKYADGWKTSTRSVQVTCSKCGGSGTSGYTTVYDG